MKAHINIFENLFQPREGVQTDIQDFVAGVSYQINKFFGNCTVKPITKDSNNLTINDMQMTDPLHLFHMDKEFAYNGEHLDRSIMMGFFAGEDPIKEGSYENMTTIVKMSSAGYLVEEDGQNGLLVPAGVVRYPTAVSVLLISIPLKLVSGLH